MTNYFQGPWQKEQLAKQESEFREAQAEELRILDLFTKHRDEILASIATIHSLQQLSQLKAEMDNVMMGIAERQANSFKYFGDRFYSLMAMSQSRMSESCEIARARLQVTAAQHAQLRATKAETDRLAEEHRQKMRETNQQISDIYSDINKNNRESADRRHKMWMATQFPRYYCPRCGNSKLYSHKYCDDCWRR